MLDLSDRRECFYWQTDRKLSPQDFEKIFLNRHLLPDEEIIRILKNGIKSMPIRSLELIPADENVVKGNVNIVRKILLNGNPFVVRMHPKGVKNGYFYVEKSALSLAKNHDIPVPEITEIHETTGEDDMDFVVMTVAQGMTLDVFLSKDISSEKALLHSAGALMAKIHSIRVEGFGPFDNMLAKEKGKLQGIHKINKDFIHTALDENLQRLQTLGVSSEKEAKAMKGVMQKFSFEPVDGARMVHNDFADWNLLTDGKEITAVLDWDECCGGDPIAELACWSLFFDLERYVPFFEGYTSVTTVPSDYEMRFHYYRLRYAISKMALRAKRYIVDKSDFMKNKIAVGKEALLSEVDWLVKKTS